MKRPMCTSILSGRSHVIEVLEENPQVCYNIFRMGKTIFRHLCNELKRLHLLEEDTGIVSVEEAVGIVLFIVGHNADYRLTTNRFQHSLETIQRWFGVPCVLSILWDVSSFGPMLMRLSFLIHFEGMKNTIHGLRTTAFRDRRSDITQNVMCACNFDMQFTYVHSGWEGSANDSRVMQDILGHAEHSSLRMVNERCFGVLKARFPILTEMHSFSISRQRLIVTVCCALHNFIRMYNWADEMFHVWEGSFVPNSDANIVAAARVGSGATEEAFNARAQRAMSEYRDAITAAMWADYTGNMIELFGNRL
ncbi:hypothetical protein SO802_016346 [Lithocarpus litseifolius]|uniref:DDE Tnp4 domain-containing protein n=1 Tax=Lithocarpus litseifolius TaxID=425828 RepID=A0AAW2CWA0_9ROSI